MDDHPAHSQGDHAHSRDGPFPFTPQDTRSHTQARCPGTPKRGTYTLSEVLWDGAKCLTRVILFAGAVLWDGAFAHGLPVTTPCKPGARTDPQGPGPTGK